MLTNSNRKNCLYFIFDLLNHINLGFSVLLKLVFFWLHGRAGRKAAAKDEVNPMMSALKSKAAQPRAGFAELSRGLEAC
jgi:hypothetical protein